VIGRCWDCGCALLVLGFELWRKAFEASAADCSFRVLGLAANDLNIEVEVGGFVLCAHHMS
jgi:hypothetical protein